MVSLLRRVIRLGLWGVAMAVSGQAHALYNLYVYESGPDVVASGIGTLVVSGLPPAAAPALPSEMIPNIGMMLVGAAPPFLVYAGVAGPGGLGGGGLAVATSSSGDPVGFQGQVGYVVVPVGYVDGTYLSSRSTWAATTLAGLGLVTGTFTFAWATDSVVVHIGVPPPTVAAAVPTLSPLVMAALAGVLAWAGAGFARNGRLRRQETPPPGKPAASRTGRAGRP